MSSKRTWKLGEFQKYTIENIYVGGDLYIKQTTGFWFIQTKFFFKYRATPTTKPYSFARCTQIVTMLPTDVCY